MLFVVVSLPLSFFIASARMFVVIVIFTHVQVALSVCVLSVCVRVSRSLFALDAFKFLSPLPRPPAHIPRSNAHSLSSIDGSAATDKDNGKFISLIEFLRRKFYVYVMISSSSSSVLVVVVLSTCLNSLVLCFCCCCFSCLFFAVVVVVAATVCCRWLRWFAHIVVAAPSPFLSSTSDCGCCFSLRFCMPR